MGSASATRKSKPAFLWQALLIVLPVTALALFGCFSIRQDRILAQHEAADRAQAFADDLLSRLWAATTAAYINDQHSFRVGSTGELLFPAPYSPAPVPEPLNLADLNENQAQAWIAAQA